MEEGVFLKKSLLISVISFILLATVVFFISAGSQGVAAENLESKQGVPVDKTWTVTFSQYMDPSTFDDDSVKVFNQSNEEIPISYELTENNRKLIVHPPEDLYMFNESYTLELSKNVKSESSTPLRNEVIFSFHTTNEVPTVKDASHLKKLIKESGNERISFKQDAVANKEETSADAAESSTGGSNDAVSGTNTQVEGVDEGDIIKATKDYTYMIRDGKVSITSNKAPDAKLVATIEEENFWPNQLYIHNHQLVVIGHGELFDRTESKQREIMPSPYVGRSVEVRFYDVQNIEEPSLERTLQLSGGYNTSRLIDNQLYVVSNQYAYFHPNAEKTPDIRPYVFDSATQQEPERLDYESIKYFPDKSARSFMTLASIDLDQLDSKASIESYLGASEDVYVSKNHMYITSTDRTYKERDSMLSVVDEHTNIQQFGLEDGEITFENEQRVPGRVLNQFSMDERNNVFSIATTTGDLWNSETPSENHLFTFDLALQPLGSVEGLAEGERIYSARFIEDRAYLVTFEQVDPLFVIDLKDPKNPTVLGQLKIPGFSNYLHPVGENQVLGFGRQTKIEDNPNGGDSFVRTTGVKISLFNVADVANPIEQDSVVLGDAGYSELNYNHKALYWHPEQNLFGLPVQMKNKDDHSWFNGAYLYELDLDKGLSEKAQISLQPEGKEEHWNYSLKRMISVGDQLYAFSNQNMKAYDLSSMDLIQELKFPQQE